MSSELLNEPKSAETKKMERKLDKTKAIVKGADKLTLDEKIFRWMNESDGNIETCGRYQEFYSGYH